MGGREGDPRNFVKLPRRNYRYWATTDIATDIFYALVPPPPLDLSGRSPRRFVGWISHLDD